MTVGVKAFVGKDFGQLQYCFAKPLPFPLILDGNNNDLPVAGVQIRVTFNGQTFTGVTEPDGTFRTAWQKDLGQGTYQANVTYLDLDGYYWQSLWDMGEDDEDGDTVPDNILVILP